LEHCYLCDDFPCKKYDKWDKDSFITHKNMMKDFEKAKTFGIKVYKKELEEKVAILNDLLVNYNDGRRKSFFCIAVNLLELTDVKNVLQQIKNETKSDDLTIKEKSSIAVKLFETIAKERNILLKLRK